MEAAPRVLRQRSQAREVPRPDGGGGLHLDADDPPPGVLGHHVHLPPRRAPVVEKPRSGPGGGRLPQELQGGEDLEQVPEQGRVGGDALLVDTEEVAGEARVGEEEPRGLHQPAPGLPGPRRQEADRHGGLQQGHVPLQGRLRDGEDARHLREVHESRGPGRDEGEEARHLHEPLHVGEGADVALEEQGQVGGEPPVPTPRVLPRERFGEAPPDHPGQEVGEAFPAPHAGGARGEGGGEEPPAHAPDLRLGEGPEREGLHPADEGLRDARDEEDVGGAREEEAPGTPVGVHGGLDGPEEAGGELHLVDDHAAGKPGQEPLGIGPGGGERDGVVQGDVGLGPPLRDEGSGEGALPRLPWPLEEHDGGIGHGGPDAGDEGSLEHPSNLPPGTLQINHKVDEFHPPDG